MNKKIARTTLERFLSFPISRTNELLNEFASLPNAIAHLDGEKNNFVFIPGTREDRVLLIAHADTVWDYFHLKENKVQTIKKRFGVYKGKNKQVGIGADDRAGVAMLWLLKESGHSILVTDGEEKGAYGSKHIKNNYPEIFDQLNNHCYMVQLDRRNATDYKTYSLPVSDEFIEFIEKSTGFTDAGKTASTDIVTLCRDICGVNFSIGYYNEHTPKEKLVFKGWFNTLKIVENILSKPQNKYNLTEKNI